MKSFLIAICLAGSASSLLWFALPAEIRTSALAVPWGLVGVFSQNLKERKQKKRIRSGKHVEITTLGAYGVSPMMMALYAALAIIALYNLLQLVGHFGFGHDAWSEDYHLVNMLAALAGAVAVGRWAGLRCNGEWRWGLVAVMGGYAVAFVINEYVNQYWHHAEGELYGVALGGAVIGLGFWWGRRNRLAAYMAYLLRILPGATRRSLVDLMHDEAQRLSPA